MGSSGVQLVLSDVDGTLLTSDKVLTDATVDAVRALHDAGIRFTVTSSRPPQGLAMLIEPLAIDVPIGAFNGGLFVDSALRVIDQHPPAVDDATGAAAKVVGVGDDHPRAAAAEVSVGATIGDGGNDTLMFARPGTSIAMGNASDEVKGEATLVTASNDDDGFARAAHELVLPD